MALVTDGRFSGATHGFMVAHVVPEAANGRPIAAVREGDSIAIDTQVGTIDLEVAPEGCGSGLAGSKPPAAHYTSGVLAKYCALVASASEGAVTTTDSVKR